MTSAEALEKAKAWGAAARPWLPYAAAVLLCLLWAKSCNQASLASAAAARAGEEAAARAGDVPVVEQVPDVRPALEAALAANRELAAELERAKAAVPGARVVGVARARTAPAPVYDVPRREGPTPATGRGEAAPPTLNERATPGPVDPPCALFIGDPLVLEVDSLQLRGKAGAELLVGTAAAYRSTDGALLLRRPFSAPLTRAVEEAQPAAAAPRWGAGPLAVVHREGWMAGALLASPGARVPLLGWRAEVIAGGALGPGGWLALGSVLVRP